MLDRFWKPFLRAKRRGHTHPTKFTEKRARRHAKNIETTQQNLLGKSNSFQSQMASKMQKCPPRKKSTFSPKTVFFAIEPRGHTNFRVQKNATPSRARQFPKIHKKKRSRGHAKNVTSKCQMLRVSRRPRIY